MPNRSSKKKRPDVNELAASIVEDATSEDEPVEEDSAPELTAEERSELARKLGRLGGLKGGKARAKKMTKEERSEAARKAAKARWGKRGEEGQVD